MGAGRSLSGTWAYRWHAAHAERRALEADPDTAAKKEWRSAAFGEQARAGTELRVTNAGAIKALD